MKHFAMIAVAAFGALLATAPVALAQNCTMTAPNCNCPPNLNGPGTAYGNVTVPNNMECLIGFEGDVTVTGNVTVGIGATLVVARNSIIVGNLQANNCKLVQLNPAGGAVTVDGSVQIGNCTGDPAAGFPAFQSDRPIHIGGDFQCHNNTRECFLESANVGGNVQVNNNVSPRPSFIGFNTIGKDLQCQNNSPRPEGSGNTVVGNPDQDSEGQCKGF